MAGKAPVRQSFLLRNGDLCGPDGLEKRVGPYLENKSKSPLSRYIHLSQLRGYLIFMERLHLATSMPCHVLNDGNRVIAQREVMVRACLSGPSGPPDAEDVVPI